MTALLIDGNNLTMRAIFAMRRSSLSTKTGVPTGPLLTAINSLSKLLGTYLPDRIMVAWDGGRSEERLALDPGYKSSRTPVTDSEREFRDSSFDLVKRFIELAGIQQEQQSGIEADDLIAAAWASASPPDFEKIVIASSDKDFLQLTGQNQQGVITELNRFEVEDALWTEERVIGELGCTPAHLPDVMALTGDQVDSVPGIPGIGPKRAVKLLGAHAWDLDAAARSLVGKHPDAPSRVSINWALVDLRHPAGYLMTQPWAPPRPGSPEQAALRDFLETYELSSIIDKLHSGALWRPLGASGRLPGRPFHGRKGR